MKQYGTPVEAGTLTQYIGKHCNVKSEYTVEVNGRDCYRGSELMDVLVVELNESEMIIDTCCKDSKSFPRIQHLPLEFITRVEQAKQYVRPEPKKEKEEKVMTGKDFMKLVIDSMNNLK